MRFMACDIDVRIDDSVLKASHYNSYWGIAFLGAFDNSGKHYFETECLNSVVQYKPGLAALFSYSLADYWYFGSSSASSGNGSVAFGGYSSTTGTRCMVAYDMDSGKVWFGASGVWFNSGNPVTGENPIFSTLSGFTVCPMLELGYGASVRFHVDPTEWLYAPTGFLPPTENHPIAKVHAFHEIDRGGELGIGGKVTEFSQPGAYKVRLYDQERGTLLATTTSAENGDYAFDELNEKPKFVIAFDHTEPVQNAAIKDNVVPS